MLIKICTIFLIYQFLQQTTCSIITSKKHFIVPQRDSSKYNYLQPLISLVVPITPKPIHKKRLSKYKISRLLANSKSSSHSETFENMNKKQLPPGCRILLDPEMPVSITNTDFPLDFYLSKGVTTIVFSGQAILYESNEPIINNEPINHQRSLQAKSFSGKHNRKSYTKLKREFATKIYNRLNLPANSIIVTAGPTLIHNTYKNDYRVYTRGTTRLTFSKQVNFDRIAGAEVFPRNSGYWDNTIDIDQDPMEHDPRLQQKQLAWEDFDIHIDFSFKHFKVCSRDINSLSRFCSKKDHCIRLAEDGSKWGCYKKHHFSCDMPYFNQNIYEEIPEDYVTQVNRISWVFYENCHYPDSFGSNPSTFAIATCKRLMNIQINQDRNKTRQYSQDIDGFQSINSYFLNDCIREFDTTTCCAENRNGKAVKQEEVYPYEDDNNWNSKCYTFSIRSGGDVSSIGFNYQTINKTLAP